MKQKRVTLNGDCPLVLVVDDNEEGRSTLKLWLERQGYRVAEAANGYEAVQAATYKRPDLILMDISMPEFDGCAAMVHIRENEAARDVPIVVLSAFEYAGLHPLLRMDVIRAGLAEYVTKPFDPAQLKGLVSRLLPTA